MKGYLVVNSFLNTEKFKELYRMFLESAREFHITVEVKTGSELMGALGFSLKDRPDFVLFFDKDVLLASFLENMNIPVFNSSKSIFLCDDKAYTCKVLSENGISIPKTYIAPKTFSNIGYSSFSFLSDVEKEISYPMIIKQRFGSFGFQVYLAENRQKAEEILKNVKGNEVLFQEFICESAGRDVRINVVGDRICGCMLRTNSNDFRSNITGGGTMSSFDPPSSYKELALSCAKAVHADFAGVDVLFSEKGPCICEVNSNPHFKSTFLSTKIDLSREILSYIQRKLK